MLNLFDILVTLMDDSKKMPELQARMRRENKFWSDGTMILSKSEEAIDALADLFDQLGGESHTGYYDPIEDEKEGKVDQYTGYYYLEVED